MLVGTHFSRRVLIFLPSLILNRSFQRQVQLQQPRIIKMSTSSSQSIQLSNSPESSQNADSQPDENMASVKISPIEHSSDKIQQREAISDSTVQESTSDQSPDNSQTSLSDSKTTLLKKETFKDTSTSIDTMSTPTRTKDSSFTRTPNSNTGFPEGASPLPDLRLSPYKDPRWCEQFVERSRQYRETFIDTHCHIDLLFSRIKEPSASNFTNFKENVQESFPVNFEGCVSVFCHPKTFHHKNPQNKILKAVLEEDNVWVTVGCHPKNATEFTQDHLEGLRRALSHHRVVALGEIGLDYSDVFHQSSHQIQKQVLRSQISLAKELSLPIVLHCRDAEPDCFDIMTEMLPSDTHIHFHCFTYNLQVAEKWTQHFPNLFIGFTPLVTYTSASDCREAATNIPLDRILLETDAPFFVPNKIKRFKVRLAHPGFALFTAEGIADLRGIPVDQVLKACRENTKKMYGI